MLGVLLFVYVLGGLTFVPILALAFVGFVFYISPVVKEDPTVRSSVREAPTSLSRGSSFGSKTSARDGKSKGSETDLPRLYKSGWVTVRRTYEPTQTGDGTYVGMITQGYRSFMDSRSKDPKRSRPKDRFFAVLKQSVLFLYEDDEQIDCAAAIEVTLHDVSLFPKATLDGELYVKRRAIRLQPRGIPMENLGEEEVETLEVSLERKEGQPAPWFILPGNNYEKEDWYFALVASSKLSGTEASTVFAKDASLFRSDDMNKLVEGIDQQPDPIPMRWLNAMLGRVFLSAYRTDALESWIISRIMKKLTRVKTPAFLSAIQVREVNVGSSTPFFSKPMLKELTADGDASMEMHVNYKGNFRITVETVATINLGARFKPYAVNLVLAVVVKEVEGTVLFKIKKPPTNRIWFGFTAMPRLVMNLEPVVSTRQIKWSMILKPIESRIREVVMESLVVPHLDDICFFNSQGYEHRGGIWGDALRKEVLVGPEHLPLNVAVAAEEAREQDENDGRIGETGESNEAGTSTARQNGAGADGLRQRIPGNDVSTLADKLFAAPSTTSLASIQSAPVLGAEPRKKGWFNSTRRQATPSAITTLPRSSPAEAGEGDDAAARLRDVLRSRPEAPQVVTPSSIEDLLSEQRSVSHSAASSSIELPGVEEEPSRSPTPQNAMGNDSAVAEGVSGPPETSSSRTSLASANSDSADLHPSTAPGTTRDPSPSSIARRVPPPVPPRSLAVDPSLPPPRRHAPSQSVDASSSLSSISSAASTVSMLSQLRTRAADKEALAASMSQAKDVMKKWGASWSAKRKPGQPFTNGFNPIDVESLEASTRQLDLDDLGLGQPKPSGEAVRAGSVAGDGSTSSKSYREHRAAMQRKTSGDQPTAVFLTPGTTGEGPTLSSPPGDELDSASSLTRKKSLSRVSASSLISDGSPQRHRSISTTNGRFLPPTVQSTRSISVSSASLGRASPPNSPTARQAPDGPRGPATPSRGLPVLSESASYKPAPTMMVPGIKDASHRFSIGSGSLNAPEQASVSNATVPASTIALSETTSTLAMHASPEQAAADPVAGVAPGSNIPKLNIELPSPPPPAAFESDDPGDRLNVPKIPPASAVSPPPLPKRAFHEPVKSTPPTLTVMPPRPVPEPPYAHAPRHGDRTPEGSAGRSEVEELDGWGFEL